MSTLADWVRICPQDRLPVGLQVPVVAQSRMFAQPWEADAGREEILRIARACERAGFFYLAVCDHVAIPRSHAPSMSAVWYDAAATLGFLAGATERLRLLSYVFIPAYRHPLAVAKTFCTLDALSAGRLVCGLGAGHLQPEFEVLGVDFAKRGVLLEEAVAALRAAFAEEYPRHEGPTYRFADFAIAPRPIQKPRPPIWIGGSTPAALRRAARLGDGWLPQGPPAMGMREGVRWILEERRKIHGEAPFEIGMNSPFFYLGGARVNFDGPVVVASPEQIAESLHAYRRDGASHVLVRFRSRSCTELVEQIERFGEEVQPLLSC